MQLHCPEIKIWPQQVNIKGQSLNDRAKGALIVGGVANLLIGLLHVVIIFVGESAYRYFGAGEEMARWAAEGSVVPPLVTALIVLVFVVFGLYGLSGADRIRKLPLRKAVLIVVSIVFTVRGLLMIQFIYWAISPDYEVDIKDMIFTLVAITIGILYFYGTVRRWKEL